MLSAITSVNPIYLTNVWKYNAACKIIHILTMSLLCIESFFAVFNKGILEILFTCDSWSQQHFKFKNIMDGRSSSVVELFSYYKRRSVGCNRPQRGQKSLLDTWCDEGESVHAKHEQRTLSTNCRPFWIKELQGGREVS